MSEIRGAPPGLDGIRVFEHDCGNPVSATVGLRWMGQVITEELTNFRQVPEAALAAWAVNDPRPDGLQLDEIGAYVNGDGTLVLDTPDGRGVPSQARTLDEWRELARASGQELRPLGAFPIAPGLVVEASEDYQRRRQIHAELLSQEDAVSRWEAALQGAMAQVSMDDMAAYLAGSPVRCAEYNPLLTPREHADRNAEELRRWRITHDMLVEAGEEPSSLPPHPHDSVEAAYGSVEAAYDRAMAACDDAERLLVVGTLEGPGGFNVPMTLGQAEALGMPIQDEAASRPAGEAPMGHGSVGYSISLTGPRQRSTVALNPNFIADEPLADETTYLSGDWLFETIQEIFKLHYKCERGGIQEIAFMRKLREMSDEFARRLPKRV